MNLSVHISGFGQMFGVPNAVVDQYLKLATPSQLKVLLYLLRSNRPNLAHDEIAKALGIPEELVEEAVLFWSQTTLFTVEEQSAEQPQKAAEQPTARPAAEKQSRGSQPHLLQTSKKCGEMSPLEISAALEASEDLKDLFRMSEQQLGRPLRHIEQKSLVWMHDGNNIGSEIILTVLLYCKSIDKCSVNYAESIITQWWNEGIHTLTQVNDAINDMEYRRSFTGHIQKAFEMHRKPTTKQQEFIDMWQDKKIPMELITYAYEKTVESTGKLVFEYLNSILTRWTEAGYRTRVDVDTKDTPPSSKKTGGKPSTPQSENGDAYQSFIYNE